MKAAKALYLVRPHGPLLNEEGNGGQVPGDSYPGMTGSKQRA